MSGLLRISETASLAIHALALLAKAGEEPLASPAISETLGASEHTLAKVLQQLGRAGLVRATRGPHGGFRLARPAESIPLLEIYESVEAPIGKPGCLLGNPACDSEPCPLGSLIRSVHQQVKEAFSALTLAELAARVRLEVKR